LKLFFRVRSGQRDRQTDFERIGSIINAVDAAMASAKKEGAALKLRLKDAQDLASMAVGTGGDEYLEREVKDQVRIAEYERQLIAGDKRTKELDAQIDNLKALDALLRERFPDFTK
jgi:hypothetical protein